MKDGNDDLLDLDVHRQAMKERIDFQDCIDKVLSAASASPVRYAVPYVECKDLA